MKTLLLSHALARSEFVGKAVFLSAQPQRTLRLGGGVSRKNELTAETRLNKVAESFGRKTLRNLGVLRVSAVSSFLRETPPPRRKVR